MYQHAPISTEAHIRSSIRRELGQDLEEIFSEFDLKPLKSGSIAQVHRATLKENGQQVAVKIQHSGLQEEVMLDIKIVEIMVGVGESLFSEFNFDWLVKDMRRNLPQELDFLIESANCEKMGDLLISEPKVNVPKIYSDLTTSKVLTMSFEQGYAITDRARMEADGISVNDVAKELSSVFSRSIFEFGFVHADPHPGNIFVRKHKSKGFELILLDHGIYRPLEPKIVDAYAELWNGIFLQDKTIIAQATVKMGLDQRDYKIFTAMVTKQK